MYNNRLHQAQHVQSSCNLKNRKRSWRKRGKGTYIDVPKKGSIKQQSNYTTQCQPKDCLSRLKNKVHYAGDVTIIQYIVYSMLIGPEYRILVLCPRMWYSPRRLGLYHILRHKTQVVYFVYTCTCRTY